MDAAQEVRVYLYAWLELGCLIEFGRLGKATQMRVGLEGIERSSWKLYYL